MTDDQRRRRKRNRISTVAQSAAVSKESKNGSTSISDEVDNDSSDSNTSDDNSLDPESVESWGDVRSIYGMMDDDHGRYAAVNFLRSKYDLMAVEGDDTLYKYDPETGIYVEGAEYDLGRELDRNLGRYYSQHEQREIISRLKQRVVDPDTLNAGECDSQLICVQNGVLDIHTRELHDHDPEYRFIDRLPVKYDDEVEPETYDEFVTEITRREADAKTLNELLGNCLMSNYQYEYVLFLFGEGANGKSTWISTVRELLGRENTSSETLQRLAENRFSTARLQGKMANVAEDLPSTKISDMGKIKDLSGGGMVPAERKNKDPFDFRNRAKLIFAANKPPVLGETTWAVKRRLAPVYLPNRFVDDPDPNDDHQKQREYGLDDELTTDEELTGILNRALDGLDRLRENGDISLTESPEERLDLYQRHSDPIKGFRVDCLTHGREYDEIEKQEVYNGYVRYCDNNNEEPVSTQIFWRTLRKTTLDVSISRPRRDGERIKILSGVRWTDDSDQHLTTAADDSDDEQDTEDDSQQLRISQLISVIEDRGPITTSEIAGETDHDTETVENQIDDLSSKGVIQNMDEGWEMT